MVWPMIFQFGDIKIVFDGLFRHLWRERDCEKTGKNEKLLDGKTFQINLKSNDKQSVNFFSDFHEYAMYCGIAWRETFQECFENITLHYSNCCILGVKAMLNSRETDRKKSAQCKVKSRHYKWLVLITENLLKNLTNFSTTHMRICVKDATPLVGYCSWINSMPKIRAFYMQALKLTLVFASLFFEAERNLETTDSSVLIRGQWPFPVTE